MIVWCYGPNSSLLKDYVMSVAEYYNFELEEVPQSLVQSLIHAKKLELSTLDSITPLWGNLDIDEDTVEIVRKELGEGKALIIVCDDSDISYAFVSSTDIANVLLETNFSAIC